MSRSTPLAAALVLSAICLLPAAAAAQPTTRGAALYADQCKGCHAANPRNDPHRPWGVRLGAGDPQMVARSFDVPAMVPLKPRLSFPGDANDLAAYLASVFAAPATAPAGRLVLPPATTFDDAVVATAGTSRAFTLGNSGSAGLDITRIASSNGAEFAITVDGCSATRLAAGASCTIAIAFSPAAAGARSAAITVTTGGGVQAFAVYGQGTVALPGSPAPAAPTALAVEYVHGGTGHYFITAATAEIAALDAGAVAGWRRTGFAFNVYARQDPGTTATCRYFTAAFPPASSHFYSASDEECAALAGSPEWTFEGEVFATLRPASDGSCPADTQAVYRLYNNGRSGAPNHRYTVDPEVRSQMIAAGHAPEGTGGGVSWCVPR